MSGNISVGQYERSPLRSDDTVILPHEWGLNHQLSLGSLGLLTRLATVLNSTDGSVTFEQLVEGEDPALVERWRSELVDAGYGNLLDTV